MAQGLDDRAQAGLRGQARHGVHGGVDRIHAGLDRGQDAGAGDARGVVGVEVDRQADLVLERLDQGAGGRGLEQARHVLDAQDVAAGGLQLLGEADIVAERVLGAVGVEDVAGVADRTLGELAGLAHGVDRDPHVLDPVQAVEDAEQVHAGVGRLLDEVADDIVGVVGVADAVGAAQQHLQEQVGDALAQAAPAAPTGPR